MIQVATALKTYFTGFGLPAYAEGSVPDDVALPYISYSLNEPEWNQKATMYAQVWDRSRSNTTIFRVADAIAADVSEGRRIELPGGYLFIWPETPLIQMLVDGDVRRAYLNFSINAYHMPGV